MGSPAPIPREDGPAVEFARLASNAAGVTTSNVAGMTQYFSARKSDGKSMMVVLLE